MVKLPSIWLPGASATACTRICLSDTAGPGRRRKCITCQAFSARLKSPGGSETEGTSRVYLCQHPAPRTPCAPRARVPSGRSSSDAHLVLERPCQRASPAHHRPHGARVRRMRLRYRRRRRPREHPHRSLLLRSLFELSPELRGQCSAIPERAAARFVCHAALRASHAVLPSA